jgi:bacteriophage N4 adsorption protein B
MIHRFFVYLNILVAVSFLLSGIDDLFVDVYYWLRAVYRRIFVRSKIRSVSESDLSSAKEKWIAIWVPAWNEHEVIDKMLENTIESLTYQNYDIFVGCYPNDEATQLAVESVRERYRQVHKIVCPNPGPTNKADCLNWVFQGTLLAEQEKGIRYEIVVLHDSEDIVHPLELKLLNWLIPRKDMVQLPVIPLERPARYWTAGTYLDEFAENHSKDLLVRERMAAVIPSAGVGTGLARAVLDELAQQRQNRLFNTNSLTEDYEFGLSLLPLKRTGILAQYSVLRAEAVTCGLWRRRQEIRQVREHVAVREFFPDQFGLAVRQKSRWVLGISLQGWRNLGWPGNFWVRYMLYRDRKALYSNAINAAGYAVIFYWLINLLCHFWGHAPALVESRWVWRVILADTFLMVHRMVERIVAVRKISGWKQALLSVPRAVVGNAINFAATAVAVKQFFTAERTGKRVVWQKTAHVFPNTKELREYRRRLGDLLLENRLLKVTQLREALTMQEGSGQKLGQVLTQLGYISEEDLLTALGRQLNVPVCSVDHRLIERAWLQRFPREAAERMLALPLRFSNGTMDVACANPAAPGLRQRLEDLLGCAVRLTMATEMDLRFAISRAYLSKDGYGGTPLGELLLSAGAITQADLDRALRLQKQTGRKLGEVLQDLDLVTPEIVTAGLRKQEAALETEMVGEFV